MPIVPIIANSSQYHLTASYLFTLFLLPRFFFAYLTPLNFQSAALVAIKTLVQPLRLQRITLCKVA
jgi:hypothetical protein